MTLEEAIEILQGLTPPPMDSWCEEYTEAIKLGIEALKRLKSQYDPDHQMMRIPLPGETIDRERR